MSQRQIYADLMRSLLASDLDGTLSHNRRNQAALLASELIKKHGALVDVLEVLRDADYRGNEPDGRRIAHEALEQDEDRRQTMKEKLAITDETINDMLEEAGRRGDDERVDVCGRALHGDEDAVIEVARIICDEGPMDG